MPDRTGSPAQQLERLTALHASSRLLVDVFAWAAAQTKKQPPTIKAVWSGPGERRSLYGAAAKKALQKSKPEAPSRPQLDGPFPTRPPGATPPQPTAPPQPARPGRGRRLVNAVGRGAKAVARAKVKTAAATGGGAIATVARGAQAAGWAVKNLGAVLKRVPVIESVFGIGSGLEKTGRRMMTQARTTALLAAGRNRGEAARRSLAAAASLLDFRFVENRRKFGFVRAAVIESAVIGIKLALLTPVVVGGLLAAGLTPSNPLAVAGALAAGGGALGGAYVVAKTTIKGVINPLIRRLVERPFRAGKGARGLTRPDRVLARRMDRAERRAAKGKRSGRFTAAPGAVTAAARADRAKAGPGALYTPGQATSRSRRFAEDGGPGQDIPEFRNSGIDPLELVTALREMLDAGAPVDVSDDDLAALVADLLEYADEVAEDGVARFAEGDWEGFAWADWKQVDGGKWKSPGGRFLSDPAYQKLSKGKPAKVEGVPKVATRNVASATPNVAPPAAPSPGWVYQVSPKEIAVDPGRFQFKLNTDAVRGVGTELTGVAKYDPELGGVLAVWRDPADGKTYVVNGHHRLDLATRAGAADVSVRYLTARTAEEARAKGALINIAEGRGTAVDAAKFLRDTGRSAGDLAAAGVSLKGQVAKDAADLVKLAPDLFRQVAFGTLDPDRAAAVARHLDGHLDQQRLLAALAKQEEKTGRSVSPKVAEAMAQEMRDSPKLTRTQETLFGPIEQDESVYFHRAELKSYVRAELAKEAKDFRLGASVRRTTALEAVAGNSLDVGQNKKVADRADAALDDFDRGARLKGALSDLLNDFAVEYSNASTGGRSQLRAKVLAAVRSVLSGGDVQRVERVEQRGPSLFAERPVRWWWRCRS